jgi:hypothetical protein
MYTVLHVKYSLFLSDCNDPWTFLTDFRKILENEISRISVQWAGNFSMPTDWRTDRQTGIKKLIVVFRNFRTPLIWVLFLTLSLSQYSVYTCGGGRRFLRKVIAILWDTKHRIPNHKSDDSSFHVLCVFH